MTGHRARAWLGLIVGLGLALPACAPVRPTERETLPRKASYATTEFKPYWWYFWTGIHQLHEGAAPLSGKGVRVAIVDTGLRFGHEDLDPAHVEGGVEFCTGQQGQAEDRRNGHGTELAGIVAGRRPGHATMGVAPDATLVPYKVVCGIARAATVHQGVARAVGVTPPADIVLIALGPWPGDTDASGNSVDVLLDSVVRRHPAALFVVASVWDTGPYPRPAWTLQPNVVLVAPMTLDATQMREVPFSAKRGDIWAPGRDVETSSIEPQDGRPYARYKMQGASAAAAIVAGCAALLKQATPGHSGAQLRQAVLDAAEEANLPDGRRLKCSRAAR